MPQDETPYTNEELRASQPSWPERGIRCPKCDTVIPQFSGLTAEDTSRLQSLICGNQRMMAQAELEALTGAPPRWAKTWVSHSGRADSIGTTAPWPYCGKPLMTARAKQCQHCLMDWHDANNPRPLGNISLW